MQTEEAPYKKYVLVDAIKSTADIYIKTGPNAKDGIKLDTPERLPLHLEHVFTDKNGKQRRTRFKIGATSIFVDEQMKPTGDNIPANEKYTDEERRFLVVNRGILVTNDVFANEFLHPDNNPQRAEFTGKNRRGLSESGIIRELDELSISRAENKYLFDLADAIVKIKTMKFGKVKELLAKFYGASYAVPMHEVDAKNVAVKALENNEEYIRIVLEGNQTLDDEITILLSKALNKGIITFDTKANFVQIRTGFDEHEQPVYRDAKLVSGDTYDEREILFKQYLSLPEGELLRQDIEKYVNQDESNDDSNDESIESNEENNSEASQDSGTDTENKSSNSTKNTNKGNKRNSKS